MSNEYGELPVSGALVLAGACAFLTAGVLAASALAAVLMAADRALDARRRRA